jgi:DNA polymerase III delta prime subunit
MNSNSNSRSSSSLFINKYQPLYFEDFETDKEMIDILNTLIYMNNLNILFIGDIGSGKTSYLKSVIREYYKDCNPTYQEMNENILEINSLKEQGIHFYRTDVKTFCQTQSSIKTKKKIVMLDDIDLINEQSQQVFRNCIDKYSHNVHFIASCSNLQKVIESLQSRLAIIKIKPLQRSNLQKIMKKIMVIENISVTQEAQEFMLNVCNNTLKILMNYMEKFKLLNEPVDLHLACNVCTNVSFFTLEEYTSFLKNGQLNNAIKLFYSIYDMGYSVMDILDNYFLFLKHTKSISEDEKYKIVPIICKYITIFRNIHEDETELALFSNEVYKILQSKNIIDI